MNKTHNNIFKDFIKYAKITLNYAKEYKETLLILLILNIILTIVRFITPIFSAKYISSFTSGAFNILLYVIIAQTAIYIIQTLLIYVTDKINRYYDFKIERKLQLELTKATLTIEQNTLNKENSGTFIERINGVSNLSSRLIYIFESIFDTISSLGVLLIIIKINLLLGISYIIIILISILYDKYQDKIKYKNKEEYYKYTDKTSGFISEIVRGIKDIKILNAEGSFLAKSSKYMDEANTKQLDFANTDNKMSTISRILSELSDFIIDLIMVYELINGRLNIETALIIYNYSGKVESLKYYLSSFQSNISAFVLSSERVYGILDDNKFPKEKFGTKTIPKFKGHIEFKNVNFSYEENIPILDNLNLEILPNEVVGFVGPSGAGKSTIFNLISALKKQILVKSYLMV